MELIVSDAHEGLQAERKAVFPSVPWQRCQFHLQQNAGHYVPKMSLRTTNLVERLNEEIRRRTQVARLFPNEAACLRLVSAILMEISEDWQTRDWQVIGYTVVMPIPPSDIALTSSHYVRVLIHQAERKGLDTKQIIRDLDIPHWALAKSDEFVSNKLTERLIRRMWRETGDEMMGMSPEGLRPGSFALGCDFMFSAASLGEFLRRGERIFDYLLPDDFGLKLSQYGDQAELVVHSYIGECDPAYFLSEFWAVILHRLPCWAINERIELYSVGFSYPEPSHSHVYEQLFPCEMLFDQPRTSLRFNKRYLSRAVVRSEQELRDFLIHSPANFFYLPGESKSLQSKIKLILKDRLGEHTIFPAFDEICNLLFMSPQTLRRRLREEGSSYQKLKDTVRCDRVLALLENPDLPVGEIAHRVGFTEPAALSRAFKKWTNLTPAQYREQVAQRRTSSLR